MYTADQQVRVVNHWPGLLESLPLCTITAGGTHVRALNPKVRVCRFAYTVCITLRVGGRPGSGYKKKKKALISWDQKYTRQLHKKKKVPCGASSDERRDVISYICGLGAHSHQSANENTRGLLYVVYGRYNKAFHFFFW